MDDAAPEHANDFATILKPYVNETGGLISGLRAVQAAYGWLPEDVVAVAAEIFNITRAEVRGVISFYADFRDRPVEGPVIRICAAEACQAVGARELRAAAEEAFGETATVEAVYCLGLCSCGPAAIVGEGLVGRADVDRIKSAIARSAERL